VGLVNGGSARNTVPAQAEALVDVRAPDAAHAERIERGLRSLLPVNPAARITVEGGFHRPPMERSRAIGRLVEQVQAMAQDMGLELVEDCKMFAGASDANFTSAMGVPTMDGMGAIGSHPHAEGENIVADELVKRTALLARAVSEL